MRAGAVGMLALAVVAVWWGAAAAKQEGARVPGPGSGVVTVAGSVTVENVPTVLATQAGEWKVAVANAPEVRVTSAAPLTFASPEFLKSRDRYVVTWASGERESVVVLEPGAAGWIRVQTDTSRARWINVALARSIEVAP